MNNDLENHENVQLILKYPRFQIYEKLKYYGEFDV